MTQPPATAHARMNSLRCFAYKPQPQPGGQCFDCGKPITEHTHIFTAKLTARSNQNYFRQELLRRPAPTAQNEVCS